MGLGPSLSIRQLQQLVLTPQLRQAIQLLQLSNLELDAFLAEELSKNPLLETRSDEPDEQPARDFAGDEADSNDAPDDPGADDLIMGEADDDRPLVNHRRARGEAGKNRVRNLESEADGRTDRAADSGTDRTRRGSANDRPVTRAFDGRALSERGDGSRDQGDGEQGCTILHGNLHCLNWADNGVGEITFP